MTVLKMEAYILHFIFLRLQQFQLKIIPWYFHFGKLYCLAKDLHVWKLNFWSTCKEWMDTHLFTCVILQTSSFFSIGNSSYENLLQSRCPFAAYQSWSPLCNQCLKVIGHIQLLWPSSSQLGHAQESADKNKYLKYIEITKCVLVIWQRLQSSLFKHYNKIHFSNNLFYIFQFSWQIE